jgi:predicted Rossmann-fold nucleotide-binding protein
LDELFEVATLIQTGKIKNYPVVLLGVDYWTPLLAFLRVPVLQNAAIGAKDLDLLLVTDSPAEAVEFIQKCAMEQFGLKYVRRKPRWLLFEEGV